MKQCHDSSKSDGAFILYKWGLSCTGK